MKILQINKFFYLRGGAERHYFDLIDLLESKGNEVIHFSMEDEKNKHSKYAKYFVSKARFDRFSFSSLWKFGRVFYSSSARRNLEKLVKDTKPDIAHVHLFYHHLSPSILLALKKLHIPVVMTIHDWQALCPNYNLLLPSGEMCTECEKGKYWHVFAKKTIKGSYAKSGIAAMAGWLHHRNKWYEKNIDKLIAPSQFAKDLFVKYGWDKQMIDVLPHFVKQVSIKSKEKNPYLLYAGRLSREKGIAKLVQYWAEKNLPFELQIAGSGPMEKEIKNIITKHKMSGRVKMLGFVESNSLNELMGLAATVIVPSLCYETFGLTVIEAWAQGTAVIASNIGSLPELITKSGAGELFSWKDDNLNEKLRSYMNDSASWQTKGEKGMEVVKKKYLPDAYYSHIMGLYNSLLSK